MPKNEVTPVTHCGVLPLYLKQGPGSAVLGLYCFISSSFGKHLNPFCMQSLAAAICKRQIETAIPNPRFIVLIENAVLLVGI